MTVVHSDMHITYEHFLKMSFGLGSGLVFVRLLGLAFCMFSALA